MLSLSHTPISVIILAITVLSSLAAFNNPELKRNMLFNPYLVKNDNQWYRAFSHAFIHADYMHLIFNMYVFYGFGTQLEFVFTNEVRWSDAFKEIPYWGDMKGRLIFIFLYVGGFLFATLPSIRKHSQNPGYNSLGASGAVSAVLMGFILLFPLAELQPLFIHIRIKAFIIGALLFMYESYMNKRGGSGVAHDAHIGGAIFGVVFLVVVNYQFLGRFINEISKFNIF